MRPVGQYRQKHNRVHFNPRTLQESATYLYARPHFEVRISIHAPYKRVRRLDTYDINGWVEFQSTYPTRECDGSYLTEDFDRDVFQSTHPTRECDHSYAFDDTVRLQISIHAPYKRVRPRPFFCSGVDAVFQSTHPTRECDVLYK